MWPGLDSIRNARDSGRGEGVRIAILDSGVDEGHDALQAARFLPAEAFQLADGTSPQLAPSPPRDVHGHGTAIAGIIHSLAPEAELFSICVLDYELRQHRPEVFHLAAVRAVEQGAHILNCSFSSPGTPLWLRRCKLWTDYAFQRDRHVVAASSNENPDEFRWPASLAQVLSVTHMDLPRESLHYRPGRLVSFAAKGENIPVLEPDNGSTIRTGSSFAAAHLTGLLARILSRHPKLSPSFAHDALRRLADADNRIATV